MYGRFVGTEVINVSRSIGKLWMRLMPGVIFCYLIQVLPGTRVWWDFPLAFFPSGGYGIAGEIVGYSDWFIGVYFIVSCLFIGLFSVHQRGAWLWIIAGMFVCWWIEMNAKPEKGLAVGGEYFSFLARGTVEGFCCMSLGMVAAFLSEHWNLRKTLSLRLLATALEMVALFMMVSFMYCSSRVHYNPIAVDLIVAALLVSSSRNWGCISALFNRFRGIMYLSRYTYSILLVQGALVCHFRYNHNFGLDSHTSSLIILISSIPLILIEYHLIEKWTVPRLKLFFINEQQTIS